MDDFVFILGEILSNKMQLLWYMYAAKDSVPMNVLTSYFLQYLSANIDEIYLLLLLIKKGINWEGLIHASYTLRSCSYCFEVMFNGYPPVSTLFIKGKAYSKEYVHKLSNNNQELPQLVAICIFTRLSEGLQKSSWISL